MAAPRSREDLGRRLLALKAQIEQEKAKEARLQGELDAITRQLKDDYGVESIEDGEARVEEEEAELKEQWERITAQLAELEDLMGDG